MQLILTFYSINEQKQMRPNVHAREGFTISNDNGYAGLKRYALYCVHVHEFNYSDITLGLQ